MENNSAQYGTYYGTLTDCISNTECFAYNEMSRTDTQKLLDTLYNAGVKNIFLDVVGSNNWSDTLFFETDDNTDFKELMVIIANVRPTEFSEEMLHHFRMWFD